MVKIDDIIGKEEEKEPTEFLGKLNRTLDELLKFKGVLIATVDTANERMNALENKLNEVKPQGIPKEITMEIEKTQELLENLVKDFKGMTKESALFSEKLEKYGKNIEEISRNQKEDSKFTEGMYNEIKDHMKITDDRFKESGAELAIIAREIAGATKLKNALRGLIVLLMEEE
jgi:chromosome segregation ATPase